MNLLLVDLDDTLVNTQQYKEKIFGELAETCGVPTDEVWKIYQTIKDENLMDQ